ncbi:hypothetical protein GCM10022197_34140 [Microlunatus spumicola]|uniref:Uncharacterized protein n=1 Tax=Microlunatus spumicola TaxID=81499 RepID=A0ABP6XZF6_9ACTN
MRRAVLARWASGDVHRREAWDGAVPVRALSGKHGGGSMYGRTVFFGTLSTGGAVRGTGPSGVSTLGPDHR